MTLNNSNIGSALVISAGERDLGGFKVRRLLPYAGRKMVGPFIFFDHMGPANLSAGEGLDVRPHPHINLATVTYLFEGQIEHRDSLGSDQLIEPGAINWMVAGRGIVHSERSSDLARHSDQRINGIQLWVALPESAEECDPSFSHHPAAALPIFEHAGAQVKLLLGKLFGYESPVALASELFYAELKVKAGAEIEFTSEPSEFEMAAYVVEGQISSHGQIVSAGQMIVAPSEKAFTFRAVTETHLMLIGGKPIGPRYIFWNFVSSSKERLELAVADWRLGPRRASSRFQKIPGDDKEFIPLPDSTEIPRASPL